jgi:hypothetical protein
MEKGRIVNDAAFSMSMSMSRLGRGAHFTEAKVDNDYSAIERLVMKTNDARLSQ